MFLKLNNIFLWRYFLVGILTSILHVTISTISFYFIFQNLFIHQTALIIANITAFIISNLFSFFLYSLWTFNIKLNKTNFKKYLFISITSFLIIFVSSDLSEESKFSPLFFALLIIIPICCLNFLINILWTFKKNWKN